MAIREGRRGRKRERRKESLSWVTKKWGGRSVGGKKSSKEESSLVRILRYSSIVERKATQTVTLRRTIDKILGRDVVYNAVETLTGTWNISVSMALDVNKRRKRRIRFGEFIENIYYRWYIYILLRCYLCLINLYII